jgi:DNA-binding NarL/FixJ family response regulator
MTSVIAAVDDLMFSSKISATARQLGIEISFARSSDDLLRLARANKPTLVIFDLNSTKLDSVRAIAAMKADAELASISMLGFVSHVDSEAIAAARAAGIDEVLARSAFTARLAEILTTG